MRKLKFIFFAVLIFALFDIAGGSVSAKHVRSGSSGKVHANLKSKARQRLERRRKLLRQKRLAAARYRKLVRQIASIDAPIQVNLKAGGMYTIGVRALNRRGKVVPATVRVKVHDFLVVRISRQNSTAILLQGQKAGTVAVIAYVPGSSRRTFITVSVEGLPTATTTTTPSSPTSNVSATVARDNQARYDKEFGRVLRSYLYILGIAVLIIIALWNGARLKKSARRLRWWKKSPIPSVTTYSPGPAVGDRGQSKISPANAFRSDMNSITQSMNQRF